jgi:leucyl-tRNA synthetase
MAVPAHDERDFEFAEKFNIPIKQVISPKDDEPVKLPYSGNGLMINSAEFDGLDADECKNKIISNLESKGAGKKAVNFKLRDWIFSRQRYWGEPIPLVWVSADDYEKAKASSGLISKLLPNQPVISKTPNSTLYALPLPESELPLELPKVKNYQPAGTGESPLATIKEWLDVWFDLSTGRTVSRTSQKPEGEHWVSATRETNTMPQWAGSCWYHLRYIDPKNSDFLVNKEKEAYWGGPDFYIGGAEHAVLHLLYARFWHRFLYDEGVLKNPEPYNKLFHQGLILGEDGNKMSKSVGNVVSPDSVIDDYGADSLRLFEMFLGPLEAVKPWSEKGIEGVHRFLKKVYRECISTEKHYLEDEGDKLTRRLLHETIHKVTESIEDLKFNVAISQMMIFVNHLQKTKSYSIDSIKDLIKLLSPFAPHVSEEMWYKIGGSPSIIDQKWPVSNKKYLSSDEMTIVFQVNGKLRGEGKFPRDCSKEKIIETAKKHEKVIAFTSGKEIVKEIYVPEKLVNIAVKG